MKTTEQYFNLPLETLLLSHDNGYTKEENLLFDDGLEVVFFDDKKEMEEERKEFTEYIQSKEYEIKATVKTINERIAVVLI